jgi:adenosylcobyric acid synthase
VTAMMIQGTSSSAGKSLIATALCRLLRRRGFDVSPFKAQNMSNNARVVEGGEIGVAQYLQAVAAGVEPTVDMNPVLVKPEGDGSSQVVVQGRAEVALSKLEWQERPAHLWPAVAQSLDRLVAEHDVIVAEGAGSSAEINLRETDLANMAVARRADARIMLVCDIDRGGALAHLYGTWALQLADDQRRLVSFLVNRFRGDRRLVEPGLHQLSLLTGMESAGVLPIIDHGLPDEDARPRWRLRCAGPRIAIVDYPTSSNLDEFWRLAQVASIVWVDRPAALAGSDLLILPGCKDVAAAFGWLEHSGLAAAVREWVAARRPALGVCGGMQILGRRFGTHTGLGLLDVETTYEPEKLVGCRVLRLPALGGCWAGLSDMAFAAYDIRHGRITQDVSQSGAVLGVACHGLLEDAAVLEQLTGARPTTSLDQAVDELADQVEQQIDVDALLRRLGVAG